MYKVEYRVHQCGDIIHQCEFCDFKTGKPVSFQQHVNALHLKPKAVETPTNNRSPGKDTNVSYSFEIVPTTTSSFTMSQNALKALQSDEENFLSSSSVENLKSDDPRVVTLQETINLSRQGRFDDVTIICGDGRFKANSFLLSAIFPALRSIFQSLSTEEDIFLSLPDVKVKDLNLLFHDIHLRKSTLQVGSSISSLLEKEVGNKLMLSESKCDDTFETEDTTFTLPLENISDVNL